MSRLPEIHVYRDGAGPWVRSIVWRRDGQEIDLVPMNVRRIERRIEDGEVPVTTVTFLAMLVEHQEQA